mmetsp:Transcript_62132/g.148189  ORF Transcript_62132/g.148189 Transcript_62132/m.148189 type:complete len:740 (+) Transcript_62132:78-2297(+)
MSSLQRVSVNAMLPLRQRLFFLVPLVACVLSAELATAASDVRDHLCGECGEESAGQVSLLQLVARDVVRSDTNDALEFEAAWAWPWQQEAQKAGHDRCDLEMAELAADMHHNRPAPPKDEAEENRTEVLDFASGEAWAMSKSMFHYLGDKTRPIMQAAHHKVVCETGFRYGTTAMAFLCLGHASMVRSYNRRDSKYVNLAVSGVNARYPGQLTLIQGDSTQMVRDSVGVWKWHNCDAVFVDGGRTYGTVVADITNFARLAQPDAMLLVDGCGNEHSGPRKAFNEAVVEGLLRNPSYETPFKDMNKTICIGHYTGAEALRAVGVLRNKTMMPRGSAVHDEGEEQPAEDSEELGEDSQSSSNRSEADAQQGSAEEGAEASQSDAHEEDKTSGEEGTDAVRGGQQHQEEGSSSPGDGDQSVNQDASQENVDQQVGQEKEGQQPTDDKEQPDSEEEGVGELPSDKEMKRIIDELESAGEHEQQSGDEDPVVHTEASLVATSEEVLEWPWKADLHKDVTECDMKMAGIMSQLHGIDRKHVNDSTWAMSQPMFHFLGATAREEFQHSTGKGKVVCETGFRYGVTAMAFLCMANADQVRSYNLRKNHFVTDAAQAVNKMYPDKLVLVHGDSTEMLRDSVGVYGWDSCNIAFVEGGRDFRTVRLDIENFAKVAVPGALLIVDGCVGDEQAGPRRAFEKAARDGLVHSVTYFNDFTNFNKTVCLARYSGEQAKQASDDISHETSKGDY